MLKKAAVALMHLSMLALASAIGAYWAIRILTPAPASVPPPPPPAVLREADPTLAARMFGLVQAAPVGQHALNVQALGGFAAGRDSAAVLVVDGKPARVYLLNQEISGGARLVEVRQDAVTIEQAGVRRDIALPSPPVLGMGGPPPPPGFTREGITLTAPSVAAAPSSTPPPRSLPPRPPAVQQAVPPQPQVQPQVQPQAPPPQQPQAPQPEQGELRAPDGGEGGGRRPARALSQ